MSAHQAAPAATSPSPVSNPSPTVSPLSDRDAGEGPLAAPLEFAPAGGARSFSSAVFDYLIGLSCRMTVLFGLYVLSIGPMYWRWYSSKFVNGSPWIAAFYEPLWVLAHLAPWFGSWIDFYVKLWDKWWF